MKFVIDENLPPALTILFARLGHDAVHVARTGLLGATDARIRQFATDEDRIVVTRDSDYDAPAPPLKVFKINIGNCSNAALFERLEGQLSSALLKLDQGDRIVSID